MSGENGARAPAVRLRDYCPDVKALIRLLEDATGMVTGAKSRLAELVGCRLETLSRWEKGGRPTKAYRPKLVELEKALKSKTFSVGEALRGEVVAAKPERKLPLMANVVDVKVEGEQALVRFALKIPGEDGSRSVAEVLVPSALLVSLRLA